MNYYDEIKSKLIDNEIYSKVKDYSKERNRVITYFEIGRLLNEAGSKYGENIIDEYSKKLVKEVGKKYNRRTLFRMKQFYNVFSSEKVSPVATQLTWSHCIKLLSIKDKNKLLYYLNTSRDLNLSRNDLRNRIKNKEYERLSKETKNKLIAKENTEVKDFIKNPIIIRNRDNYEFISEKTLQKLILEDIPSFLDELGEGFTFIKNEYKIKLGDRYNYIDLLLFNYKYNCFVVVELKVTELKKEHIGQIKLYMNYIDKNKKSINQDSTIGIIICKKGSEFVMEYCSNNRIFETNFILN